jgi:hypothetical protein
MTHPLLPPPPFFAGSSRPERGASIGTSPTTSAAAVTVPTGPAPTGPATTDTPATPAPGLSTIVITADHVYLPLDENGVGTFDWPVSNVPTTKVLRRQRLKVPDDLAVFLSERDQAEILSDSLSDTPSAGLPAEALAKAGA